MYSAENPFSKRQTKWLVSKGFDVTTYHWSDTEINEDLKQSLKLRNRSNVVGLTGGSLVLFNLFLNTMSHLAHDLSERTDKGEFQPINAPYYIGGALIGYSIGLAFKSESKIKKTVEAKNTR